MKVVKVCLIHASMCSVMIKLFTMHSYLPMLICLLLLMGEILVVTVRMATSVRSYLVEKEILMKHLLAGTQKVRSLDLVYFESANIS